MRTTFRKAASSALNLLPASLRKFIRNIREACHRNDPALMTPWGFLLSGQEHMASGDFEPEETQLVLSLLDIGQKKLFINVGANVGYYCAHALRKGIATIAIEPHPANLHHLLRNIQANNWTSQCEVYPVACGSQADILQMRGRGGGASLIKGWASNQRDRALLVPILPLDTIVAGRSKGHETLILVDVEGAEWMVMQGAQQTLIAEPRPTWMVEIFSTRQKNQPKSANFHIHFSDVFSTFFAAGYRAFTADLHRTEIDEDFVQSAAKTGHGLPSKNFLFIPRGLAER